jgi:hypothetical protein
MLNMIQHLTESRTNETLKSWNQILNRVQDDIT